MKICIIGCSFSKFSGPDGDIECWPKKLAKNKSLQIYNTSIFGNSLDNQLFQIQEYINNFDNFIVQLTVPFRKTFSQDVNKYRKKLITFDTTDNYSELRDSFNFGNSFENNIAVNYNASLVHNTSSNLAKHWTFDMRHNIINYVNSYHEMVALQIKNLLKEKNSIVYSHLDRFGDNVDFTIQNDLDNNTWNNYVVDNGFHFGNQGTQYIADKIQEKINLWI